MSKSCIDFDKQTITLGSTGTITLGSTQLTEERLSNLLNTYTKASIASYIEIPQGTALAYMRMVAPSNIAIDNEKALLKFGPEYESVYLGTIEDVATLISSGIPYNDYDVSIILNPLETYYTTSVEMGGGEGSGGAIKKSYAGRVIYTISGKTPIAPNEETLRYNLTVTMHYLKEV